LAIAAAAALYSLTRIVQFSSDDSSRFLRWAGQPLWWSSVAAIVACLTGLVVAGLTSRLLGAFGLGALIAIAISLLLGGTYLFLRRNDPDDKLRVSIAELKAPPTFEHERPAEITDGHRVLRSWTVQPGDGAAVCARLRESLAVWADGEPVDKSAGATSVGSNPGGLICVWRVVHEGWPAVATVRSSSAGSSEGFEVEVTLAPPGLL
jgi:hypothetical protein